MPSALTHTQHLPLASLCFNFLPKEFIFGLPLQSTRMPQTFKKDSLVHVRVRQKCSSWFCCVALSIFLILFRSPSEIMSWYFRSNMMASASTSVMKRCRKSSRTCSAAYVEREELCYTKLPTPQVHCRTTLPPPTLSRCVYTKGYTLMVQEYHQVMVQQYKWSLPQCAVLCGSSEGKANRPSQECHKATNRKVEWSGKCGWPTTGNVNKDQVQYTGTKLATNYVPNAVLVWSPKTNWLTGLPVHL